MRLAAAAPSRVPTVTAHLANRRPRAERARWRTPPHRERRGRGHGRSAGYPPTRGPSEARWALGLTGCPESPPGRAGPWLAGHRRLCRRGSKAPDISYVHARHEHDGWYGERPPWGGGVASRAASTHRNGLVTREKNL